MRVAMWASVSATCALALALVASHRDRDRTGATSIAGEAGARASLRPKTFPCAIRGTMHVDGQLVAQRDGNAPIARFARLSTDVELHAAPAMAPERLLVSAGKRGFTLEGFVDREQLHFSARRRIALAGSTAWIAMGTRLALKAGVEHRVVVSPPVDQLQPIDALVECESVAIGFVDDEEKSRPSEESTVMFTLVGDRLPIAPSPGAEPTFTLRPKAPHDFVLMIAERKEGLHLTYRDGIVVEGWVRREDVKPPTHLYGIGFHCGGVKMAHGVVEPKRAAQLAYARRRTSIGVGSALPGEKRGTLEKGSEVIVLGIEGALASVLPRCRELEPIEGSKFWVATDDLDVSASTFELRALDRACHGAGAE